MCGDLIRVFSCLANPQSAEPAQKKKLKRRSIVEAKGKVRVLFCTMLPYFRKSFGF